MAKTGLTRKGGRTVMGGVVHPLVYGPVDSRRYGRSLGLNILPPEVKHCNWDCGYCQLGRTDLEAMRKATLPSREEVRRRLEERFVDLREAGEGLDRITLAGNGEPTLHPEFPGIVEDTLELRDRHYPGVPVGILSNGATVHAERVRAALDRLDERVLKLDAGRPETFQAVDVPLFGFDLERLLRTLEAMEGIVIQALFHQGPVDNTTDEEIDAWLALLRRVGPAGVEIYSLDRDPADPRLRPCPAERLEEIARRVREELGLDCRAF